MGNSLEEHKGKTTHLHLDLDPGAREGRQKRESIGG
jgi:hypothetical protein